MGFFDDIWEFLKKASIVVQAAGTALGALIAVWPKVAEFVRPLVEGWFEKMDEAKKDGAGDDAIEEMKKAAEADVLAQTMAKFHGSGSLVPTSIVKSMIALYVTVLKGMRYGENTVRNDKAMLRGYANTKEDAKRAFKTHAGWKLFGE